MSEDFSKADTISYLNGLLVSTHDKEYFFTWGDINDMIPNTGSFPDNADLRTTLAANTHVCEYLETPVNNRSHWVYR